MSKDDFNHLYTLITNSSGLIVLVEKEYFEYLTYDNEPIWKPLNVEGLELIPISTKVEVNEDNPNKTTCTLNYELLYSKIPITSSQIETFTFVTNEDGTHEVKYNNEQESEEYNSEIITFPIRYNNKGINTPVFLNAINSIVHLHIKAIIPKESSSVKKEVTL